MTDLNFNPVQAAEDNGQGNPIGTFIAAIDKKDFNYETPKNKKKGILIDFVIAEGENKGKSISRFFDVYAENTTRQAIERAELGQLAKAIGLSKEESYKGDGYVGFLKIVSSTQVGKDGVTRGVLKFHSKDTEVATPAAASF
jgi:hypothetical protein